jgi:hypothetical protein
MKELDATTVSNAEIAPIKHGNEQEKLCNRSDFLILRVFNIQVLPVVTEPVSSIPKSIIMLPYPEAVKHISYLLKLLQYDSFQSFCYNENK